MSSVGNRKERKEGERKKNMYLCVYILLSNLGQHVFCVATQKQHCQTLIKLTVELRMNTVTHVGDICHVGCVVVTKMIQHNRVCL